MGCCPSWTDSCMGFPQASDLQVLLQHGTPMDNSPPRAAAPVQVILLLGFSMGCTSFRPHPLLHCGLVHGCMQRCTLCGVPCTAEVFLLQHLERLLLLLFSDLAKVSYYVLHCSPIAILCISFSTFLNMLSQTYNLHYSLAYVMPTPFWVVWNLLCSHLKQLLNSSEKPPLQAHHYHNLAT